MITIGILGGIALIIVLILWKELKLLIFDEGFAASIGFPIRTLDVLLTSLLVIAIVIGLQAVGAVLMSAMIVAPAVAARQWTDRFSLMVTLAAIFGAVSGVIGTIISSTAAQIPTGPTIILSATLFVIISITLAPNRGLVWNSSRQRRNRRNIRMTSKQLIEQPQQKSD